MSEDIVPRDEVRATLAARRELGEDMEPALIDAFVERIEPPARPRGPRAREGHQAEAGAPAGDGAVALAAIFTGLWGVIVVCSALVLIAVVSAR